MGDGLILGHFIGILYLYGRAWAQKRKGQNKKMKRCILLSKMVFLASSRGIFLKVKRYFGLFDENFGEFKRGFVKQYVVLESY